MTDPGVIELESFKLARFIEQVLCYICGEGNTSHAELCRNCFAPMALTHQARSQGVSPQMVACLGATGAGKTVYLGMLMDILSRNQRTLQLLARGAFSISLQQSTMAALARCEFPNKTPGEPDRWHWVHCQVAMMARKQKLELVLPDLAGEALMEELDHPNAFPVLRSLLTHCAGVTVLIDAQRIEEGEGDQEFFTMKLLSYLAELSAESPISWQKRPVALIFSKADLTENCFDDPLAYAERHLPGLIAHCRERFSKFRFFAAGVAGAVGYRRRGGARILYPLRIEPRGIVEPFLWLMEQIHVAKRS